MLITLKNFHFPLEGIETNITKRWENGTKHHPESIKLASIIAELDWNFGNDWFCFKFGGDGDKYFLGRDTFHQVERVSPGPLMTKLVRGRVVKELARIVLMPGKEPVCPFSRVLPEAELWELVEDSLK